MSKSRKLSDKSNDDLERIYLTHLNQHLLHPNTTLSENSAKIMKIVLRELRWRAFWRGFKNGLTFGLYSLFNKKEV